MRYTGIDYDPFGMLLVGRTFDVNYRYGFNGKEHDTDPYGQGNVYDYGFRIYNPRLGKFLSVDPLTKSYAFYTPYQFAGNKPIAFVDQDGLEELWYNFVKVGTINEKDFPVLAVISQVEVEHEGEIINIGSVLNDFTNPELNNEYNGLIIENPSLNYGTGNTTYLNYSLLKSWYDDYNSGNEAKKSQVILDIGFKILYLREAEIIKFLESEALKMTIEQKKNLVLTQYGIIDNTDVKNPRLLGNGIDGIKEAGKIYLVTDLGEKSKVTVHELLHWYTGIIKKSRPVGTPNKNKLDHKEMFDRESDFTGPNEGIGENTLLGKIFKKIDEIIIQMQSETEK